MQRGIIQRAQDVAERATILLSAVERLGLSIETPDADAASAAARVHSADYLLFLETVFERWRELDEAGPEVLPNMAPYWGSGPERDARPPCRSSSVVAEAGYYVGDLAAPIGPATWVSALASARTAASAADAVSTQGGTAYGLCRPSGHHARRDRASGFCYLNNAAIAAERLRLSFSKVAILDVDAHHGDGTQQIFYARPDVLTLSIHADPSVYYPFYTGYADEAGFGAGQGFNLNYPLEPGTGDQAFLAVLGRALEAVAEFGAEALVLGLGFDAHRADPIGILDLTTAAFRDLGRCVAGARLPTVVVQEGGYGLAVIGESLEAFLTGLDASASS